MADATFADLLDRELDRAADEAAEPSAANPEQPRPVMASSLPAFRPFVRVDMPFISTRTAYGRLMLTGPTGTMTAGEACARLALESAAISSTDFSLAELRSAFRQLAREHHPDRHPHATAAEAAQWSGSFADVERRYRRLAADLAARH